MIMKIKLLKKILYSNNYGVESFIGNKKVIMAEYIWNGDFKYFKFFDVKINKYNKKELNKVKK